MKDHLEDLLQLDAFHYLRAHGLEKLEFRPRLLGTVAESSHRLDDVNLGL